MRKMMFVFFALMAIAMMTMPAYAQGAGGTAPVGPNYVALASGIGIAIASGLAGLGQGRVGAAACEGAARNPGAAGKIQTMMILGLALIESLVLFALLVVFAVVKPIAG